MAGGGGNTTNDGMDMQMKSEGSREVGEGQGQAKDRDGDIGGRERELGEETRGEGEGSHGLGLGAGPEWSCVMRTDVPRPPLSAVVADGALGLHAFVGRKGRSVEVLGNHVWYLPGEAMPALCCFFVRFPPSVALVRRRRPIGCKFLSTSVLLQQVSSVS